MNKDSSKKVTGVKVFISLLTVLLIISTGGYAYLQSKLNKINRPIESPEVLPEDEYFEADEDADYEENEVIVVEPDEVEWPIDEGVTKDKDIINILLIGQDRRPGENRARSDSMMIATINKKNNMIKITSLMRDLYVQIPGYSDNRINAAYAFGGMKLLNATIEKNFLVHIDANIEVDFNGFQQAIDMIGGIDIYINSREAEHLRKSGFPNLSEGTAHMDGKLALAYSRIRRIGNADYERTERQRRVITTVYKKTKDLGLNKILNLVDEIFPLVTTDLTNMEIMGLAFTILSMDLDHIDTNRIPLDGTFSSARIRGMAVLVPDLSKNRQALKEIIYGD